MDFNVEHILQGWKNLAFPKKEIKEFLQNLENQRMMICKACEHRTALGTCGICGCYLKAKARCTDCSCPIGKWSAIATSEQDEIIQNALNN